MEHKEVDRGARPTWDKATDEQILEEVRAIEASAYNYVTFSSKVWTFLEDRGLRAQVIEILGIKCLPPEGA